MMPSTADQSTTITIGSIPDTQMLASTSDSSSASLLINNNNDLQQHHHHHHHHQHHNHQHNGGSGQIIDPQQQHQSPMVRLVERNYQYLQSQLGQLIRARLQNSHTFFTPGICGTITLLYLLNVLLSSGSSSSSYNASTFISTMLTLSPGNILAPNYWLFSCVSTLTYPFVEFHWWQVLTDILIVSVCTTLIEPLWGRRELILFFFVVNLSVAFFTIVHYIFLYSIYGDTKYLYNVHMYGLSGYCAAVCVTIKQILPESVLVATSFGKLKNNHVPLCALLISYTFYLANFIDGCLTLMFLYGLLTSWFYLRFVQFHPSNGLRGDLSPSFDFCTFFPNVLKPFVAVMANSCYTLFVRLRLLSPASHRQYQNLRVLSERLSQEHSGVIIAKHFKHHQSGDYQHLHQQQQLQQQPRIENM